MTQDVKLNIVLLVLWLVPLIVTFGIWSDLNRRIAPQWLLVDTLNHPTMFFWLVAGFFPVVNLVAMGYILRTKEEMRLAIRRDLNEAFAAHARGIAKYPTQSRATGYPHATPPPAPPMKQERKPTVIQPPEGVDPRIINLQDRLLFEEAFRNQPEMLASFKERHPFIWEDQDHESGPR